jgi:hypothetical protein
MATDSTANNIIGGEKCGDLGGRIARNIFAFICLIGEAEDTACNYVKQPKP